MAIRRKALQESLTACSNALRKHVKGRKMMKQKNPLGALDLGRLAQAAGLSCADHQAMAWSSRVLVPHEDQQQEAAPRADLWCAPIIYEALLHPVVVLDLRLCAYLGSLAPVSV